MHTPFRTALRPLPARAGMGLKAKHFRAILETRPEVGFFEIHAENYLVAGGPLHHYLERIRADYPLSIHGVGLSLGAEAPIDLVHLERVAQLVERYAPAEFSEHLAWSTHAGIFLNDLLPLPYDTVTLDRMCAHIDQVQTRLRRRILLENPATYLLHASSTLDEADFICELVRRSGCGLLLDLTNAHVSAVNHHRDLATYLDALPLASVGEIHLAGYASDHDDNGDTLLIDNHGAAVEPRVWQLFEHMLERLGPIATLIERDSDLPALDVLLAEVRLADGKIMRVGSDMRAVSA